MKLLVQSAIIFFGTLIAAALLALGEPATEQPAATRGSQTADATPSR
jgi:hypothetical protein